MKRLVKALKVDFHDGYDPEKVNESVFKLLTTGAVDCEDIDNTYFAYDDLTEYHGDVCEVKVYPNGDVKSEPVIVHTYPAYVSAIVNGDYNVVEEE